jgi:glycine cleavage system protein P-like pyridoxal-binding family
MTSFPVILEPLLAELSGQGRNGLATPQPFDESLCKDLPVNPDLPGLPEVSEVETVRHFTRL